MCHDDEDITAASGGGCDDDDGGDNRCTGINVNNKDDNEQQQQQQVPIKQQEKQDQDSQQQQHQICDSLHEDMDADVEDVDDEEVEEEEEEEDEDDDNDEDDDEDDNNEDNLEVGIQEPNSRIFLSPQQKSSQQQIDHLSNSSNESQSHHLNQQHNNNNNNHHHHHHHHQQQQHLSHQNHIQLLRNALEKLDPDKNGLALVPKEITSSTLTTRLKGVCKINRLIDHSNDLCHSFTEIGAQAKYQESTNKFRDWILKNKIIEHIFGPNCHVEIIKQSLPILNFVAYSLNDEHVDVMWSASLLKHCGRQVLDLLTSLIRFMRTGPVLHLYELVKNLSVEDHSEHTLLLTSHILRFIWSHSPCINQLQFCSLQKVKQLDNTLEQESDNDHDLDQNNQPQEHQQQPQQQQKINHPPSYEQRKQFINALMDSSEGHWIRPWKNNNDFLDNTSDVSACCSEEKNMGDFDDDSVAQSFIQDENTLGVESLGVNSTTSVSDLYPTTQPSNQREDVQDNMDILQPKETHYESSTSRLSDINASDGGCLGETSNKHELIEINDSNDEASRGSSSSEQVKFRLENSRNVNQHFQQQQQHHHQQQQHIPISITQFMELKKASYHISCMTESSADLEFRGLSEYNLISLSEPGKTLLWDLLQDGNIERLATNLHVEIENVLINLVMSFGDRYIRYKFIEACLENLANGDSVILSLRLLPRLLSFNTITRNVPAPAINETHTIVLWAERVYGMSENFFINLLDYYEDRDNQQKELLLASSEEFSIKTDLTEEQQKQLLLKQQQRLLELEYESEHCKSPLFSHIDKIITRMSFLTFIYSRPFSPDSMRLDRFQLDQLWDCLTSDTNVKCSDVLFQWIYQQSMSDDFHGLSSELFDYVLNNKLPSLEPEHFRLRGLKLLEQLMWNKQEYECCHGLENPATRLLWDIGLKAIDDEVSLAAIRILNHFYIYSNHNNSMKCDKGINFMSYCMDQLDSSLTNLTSFVSANQNKIEDEDYINEMNHLLDVMQRVILLIRTHLEVFRAHWSFYLRILQLNNEADLISHRLNAYEIKITMTIRLVCQAASTLDKTTIEVQTGDFVGELRAEILRWWYTHVDQTFFEQNNNIHCSTTSMNQTATTINSEDLLSPTSSSSSTTSSSLNKNKQNIDNNEDLNDKDNLQQDSFINRVRSFSKSSSTMDGSINNNNKSLNAFTEFLLANRHSLRLLSHNQEIPHDCDERQITELDMKDMQVIYVLNEVKPTTSSSNDPNVDDMDESNRSNESAEINYLPKTEIPSILLLRCEYFERLMEADRFLGLFNSKNDDLTNRAKTLSRRVWEIIQILPTCPNYKNDLKKCGLPGDDWRLKTPQCSNLLSAQCPQRLLYSLQIIDILKSSDNPNWGNTFIRKGGLADIFDVFMTQKLLPDENEDWNEWLQECLAYLLKLLFQFGTKPIIHQQPLSSNESQSSSSSSSSKMSVCGGTSSRNIIINNNNPGGSIKRIRRNRSRLIGVAPEDRLPIPQFSDELLKLLSNTDQIFDKLIKILKASAFCNTKSDQYYYVTMSSRAMIVHHVMSFLSSWCKSDRKFPKFQISDYEQLLKALILDDADASTRREACNGFFKLHHSCTTSLAIRTFNQTTPINTSVDSIYSTMNSSTSFDSSSDMISSINNENVCNQQQKPMIDWTFSADLLKCLIKFLPIAEVMKPIKAIKNYVPEYDCVKEVNTHGCKDYFWLTCRLIDSPATMNLSSNIMETNSSRCPNTSPDSKQQQDDNCPSSSSTCSSSFKESKSSTVSSEEYNLPSSTGGGSIHEGGDNVNREKFNTIDPLVGQQSCSVNLFELCQYLVVAIRKRETYETRNFSVEDDTLRGMLLMMVMALKRDPTFRYTSTAFEFVHELYDYLFAPPNQTQRYLPKCKAPATRSTAFDLMIALVERCPKNYFGLLELLLYDQHNSVVKGTYPTDYWPHDDCRSEVGFVGLINLGATCYLATCMQHLFMIPNLRYAILSIEDTKNIRHGEIIRELQKIFTFMLESERKAYNPRNFCKVYTMDNHPLNIAEQTDMTEFLTDLITKLEESSPELRQIIKELFSGTLSNNVVSLDCSHISRTTEEFYTLRVQVADMRNLNDSLDELTVKDTLEGDNMYTCSTCEKKVRAEKRACIVKLPRILCFNTMRYTFNMATMTKEKVNTHFSFPLKLDMSDYLETNLMRRQQSSSTTNSYSSKDSLTSSSTSSSSASNDKHEILSSPTLSSDLKQQNQKPSNIKVTTTKKQSTSEQKNIVNKQSGTISPESINSESNSSSSTSSHGVKSQTLNNSSIKDGEESDTIYELIGVTVHTGNADGGHYYCFIRDCEDQTSDKPRWYLFNDAEVKHFDDSHIGAECYGGELTTKSYDAINDRFMDFSIEKTNSAYMLFYKRVDYKYHSRSVARRYLESDTQRSTMSNIINDLCYEKNLFLKKQQHNEQDNTGILDSDKMDTSDNSSATTKNLEQESQSSQINQKLPTKDILERTTTKINKQQLQESSKVCYKTLTELDFNELCQRTYEDFKLPKYLANWIWTDNMKFARDKSVFEHNYFNFMWQICGNIPKTLNNIPENLNNSLLQQYHQQQQQQNASGASSSTCQASEDVIAIRTVHLAIAFVLGVLMNSRERPNLSNWTELIRKQFNSSKAACDWLMHLIDDEETWLKQMLLKCPIEMVRQLFQRLCNDLTGSKQHKKLRLIR